MRYRDVLMVEAISRNSPAGRFLAHFDRMRSDPHEPMLGVGRDYEFDSVDVAFNLRPLTDQSIVLQSLSAASPRGGEGSKAMQLLCAVADRFGVEMLLSAGPYSTPNAEAMPRDKLMAWYSRFGFVSIDDPEKPSDMRREPKGMQEAVRESQQRIHLDFDSLYGRAFKITDPEGAPNRTGFSIISRFANGSVWDEWQERPQFKAVVKQRLNDPGFLADYKYQQIVDSARRLGLLNATVQVSESLSRPHPYEWTIREPGKQQAEFSIGDTTYWVMAYVSRGTLPPAKQPEDLWVIQFGIDSEASVKLHGHVHGIMEPTKLGRQFSVLSTVRAIIDDFIAQEHPQTIWFSALAKMAASRLRLYRRFAEYVASKHGYHFDDAVMRHFAEDGEGGGVWLLRRNSSYLPRTDETMKLDEAKLASDLAAPVTSLRRHGWRLVNYGLGKYGAVMQKPGRDYLLKLFITEDRAYEAFVRLAQSHPENPHFPRITGDILRATRTYSVVRIERLTPNNSAAMVKFCHWTGVYMEDREQPQKEALDYVSQSPHLVEACNLIADNLLHRFNLDLEVKNNVMMRGSTFVFSDPVAMALDA